MYCCISCVYIDFRSPARPVTWAAIALTLTWLTGYWTVSFSVRSYSTRWFQLPSQKPSVPTETPNPSNSVPCVSMIGAAAFLRASKRPGIQCFCSSVCIRLSDPSLSTKSSSVSDEAPNLLKIPKEYHDYTDVFSKAKASKLPLHCLYDFKITLEEGTSPPSPPISVMYSPSPTVRGWPPHKSHRWITPEVLLLTEVQNHYLHLSYIYYCTWSVHLYVLMYYSDR